MLENRAVFRLYENKVKAKVISVCNKEEVVQCPRCIQANKSVTSSKKELKR